MELLKFFIVSRTKYNTGVKVSGLEQGIHRDYDYYHIRDVLIRYKDGKRHGIIRGWVYGLLTFEHNRVNGKLHGLCRYWYENGQLWMEYHFIDGQRHGLYRLWNKNGLLKYECHYVHGIRQN